MKLSKALQVREVEQLRQAGSFRVLKAGLESSFMQRCGPTVGWPCLHLKNIKPIFMHRENFQAAQARCGWLDILARTTTPNDLEIVLSCGM